MVLEIFSNVNEHNSIMVLFTVYMFCNVDGP